jgi:hypothetical protein
METGQQSQMVTVNAAPPRATSDCRQLVSASDWPRADAVSHLNSAADAIIGRWGREWYLDLPERLPLGPLRHA